MELIIDFDKINDSAKKKFLLETLRFLGVPFKTDGNPQTLEEYNNELEEGDTEIEKGKYTTMEGLLKEMERW
ncbi:hypothetical protein [Niabella drilacis]|uniref:Uncharacterized protein n=1 Tax=Niabella drilacis (strain DSM 25811 / CCM 8410 / CCUG 62505 / LMG 26954 / E90) TaxID=1285928 RepID=A0A1G6PW22_NIADE|nr:hypothetical protein [Niabella drilacis]SDC83575.1 hypothetical protein SAMN04487894_104163 [Niabella drilacis]